MLDLLAAFATRRGDCFLRLDGGTPVAERQPMVDNFNTHPEVGWLRAPP